MYSVKTALIKIGVRVDFEILHLSEIVLSGFNVFIILIFLRISCD